MKSSHTSRISRIELASIATIALVSLYCAAAWCLNSDTTYLRRACPAGRGRNANHAENPQDVAASLGCRLIASLPRNWQVDLEGGRLWITRHDPDGTVSGRMSFDGPGQFYGWAKTHPNLCDVNIPEPAPYVP